MSMQFSEYLKNKRIELGFRSQGALAKKLGVHYMTVQKWELGKAFPSIENVKALAKIFEMPARVIVDMINPNTPKANISFIYDTASKISDFHSSKIFNLKKDLQINEGLLDSLVYKIKGDFMKPLIKDGQKVIISYSHDVKDYNQGDIVILDIQVTEGDYSVQLRNFKKVNDQRLSVSVKSGSDYVFGVLRKKENNFWVVTGLKNKKSQMSIDIKDIGLKMQVLGILF